MHAPVHSTSLAAGHHCIFCDLIKGAAEVSMCYEDQQVIAFMDIQPVNQGHVLVVPREHYETLRDIPRDVGQHMYDVATRLIPVIQEVSGAEDMNIVVNSGAAAGQNVFHYHIHLIPRREGDGFDVPLPFPGSEMPNRHLLDAMAVRIGSALRSQKANQAR
ncbi:MAG: HIT family protein [Gemmatimonadaceae bacterium]|jgi:histidine triad (HIT) family protein|nr:HIT family protein [Gemmatimonadaceae bacterium]